MGAFRDEEMLGAMEASDRGYRDGVNTERHRVAEFLDVTPEVVGGINLIDKEKRVETLRAIIDGARRKIQEIIDGNG